MNRIEEQINDLTESLKKKKSQLDQARNLFEFLLDEIRFYTKEAPDNQEFREEINEYVERIIKLSQDIRGLEGYLGKHAQSLVKREQERTRLYKQAAAQAA